MTVQQLMKIDSQDVANGRAQPAFHHQVGANDAAIAIEQAHHLWQRIGDALPFALGAGDRRIVPS